MVLLKQNLFSLAIWDVVLFVRMSGC
uniref:Uncharacterized protein n=1 Tax=Arundo donax TaxID=35708 RepID=A0A0A9CAU4_ARUDO